MIREVKKEDFERIYQLGELLIEDYRKLYNLDKIVKDGFSYIFVCEQDKKVVGFIHIIKLYEVIDIVDIVVDKNYRGKGIGTLLIGAIFSKFDDTKSVTLEVNVNNKVAIGLYEKTGFEVVCVRKRYYNGEDGYLMKRCF